MSIWYSFLRLKDLLLSIFLQMRWRSSTKTRYHYWMWTRMCSRSRLSNRIYMPRSKVTSRYSISKLNKTSISKGFMKLLTFINFLRRCIEKPDPCNPSPCGPGTMCMANKFGNPICRCLGKLVPKPDTITGCGPECTVSIY